MKLSFFFLTTAFFSLNVLLGQSSSEKKLDWMLDNSKRYSSQINIDGSQIELKNGLVKRSFKLAPNAYCFDYTNLVTGQQLIRAVGPEAQIQINNEWFNVGGVYGQKEKAYLRFDWLENFQKNEKDFQFIGYETSDLAPLLNWNGEKWWAMNKTAGTGKVLTLRFITPSNFKFSKLEVKVHYAIYDKLPLISKWVTVHNLGAQSVHINQLIHERIAIVEEESAVVGKVEDMRKQQGIYIESNFAFNNAMRYHLSDQSLHWSIDSTYKSQVNYDYSTPTLLEIYPKKGLGIQLSSNDTLTSIRSWELLMDSYDRERRGLAIRMMYRAVAPWVTANPIFMHLVSRNDEQVYSAIDQCAVTGYEAVILSFGSHVNMEDTSAQNLTNLKKIADYAHEKNIKIGTYSLFSSRKISEDDDVINPITGKTGGTFFGNAPCFGSKWGIEYAQRIKIFFEKTNFDIWENDGPFPGDQCASTNHPGHHSLEDSQWKQFAMQKELYHWLNARGVYINSPDWYFLDGSNKTGIGYREVNFALPRENQRILNRQNIYDALWEQTPSMGWGFVPLTAYHGGGKDAVLEPLNDHLEDYKQLMMQYYGAGVQACYRGPRLYDTDATRQVVSEVVHWYKSYRNILNSDIIHLRRADGRDWDGFLHVNAHERGIKGLGMVFNPLKTTITRTIQLPLYYTGLDKTVKLSIEGKKGIRHKIGRDYKVNYTITIPAGSYTWFTIE